MKKYSIPFFLIFAALLFADGPAKVRYTNHLAGESSPYLQQHAHNPVDWYPWGEEAFEKARREHKPIFLSIGYSTCHWCHVMERESFENPDIAELINRWFVPVKVDREEMPDLDSHFQRVYSLLHRRSGGWPLTLFLTEEGKPFFAATYIPADDGYGVRGLRTLLPTFGRLYHDNPRRIRKRAEAIDALMKRSTRVPPQKIDAGLKIADRAVEAMWKYYDKTYKGFWDRPKFPESSRIRLLLDIVRLDGNEKAETMALETLDAMQSNGLYDQVDGAFFRYCVDRAWIIPHFEKMLYTNAELIPLYVKAWEMTGRERFKTVVRETIAETNRRFRTKEGLYFGASDADSDGEEGGYFLYRYDDAYQRLKEAGFNDDEAREMLHFFGIEKNGTFDGDLSHARRTAKREPAGYEKAKAVLKAMRKGRTFPFIDKKIITAWNGMMVKALFVASRIDAAYAGEAESSYRALKSLMQKSDGSLYHQTLYGQSPSREGLLEDYAFMADAALEGYETTLKPDYLKDAKRWADLAIDKFHKGGGRWVLGLSDVTAWADISDRYYTSPLSKMVVNLGKLALLESDPSYEGLALRTLEARGKALLSHPDAYPEALRAYLQLRKGWVGIKSNRGNLLKHRREIASIDYPYILLETEETDGYVACNMRACFAFGKELETVAKAVEAED
ncbi:thioredoxin domain-containing protein [Hydrogenimonas sp. SS33]|uniref:thioredoxin domain-containing protein n=1 Tax=Hydrogenimonas leucolamina TaxID=2954236 RepID=UPI00336BC52C